MIKALCHKYFKEDPKHYSLHWAVTNNCNYQCDYCGVYKKEKYYDSQNVIEFINFLQSVYNVETVLFGGEPLIHPNILQIIGELKTNIKICTNLSENIGFFRQLTGINRDLQIVASFHYHKDDLADFYEKIAYLIDYSEFVKIKVMFDSRYSEEIKRVYDFLLPLELKNDNFVVQLDMVYHEICNFPDEDIGFFEKVQDDKSFWVKMQHEVPKLISSYEGKKEIFTSYNEIRRMFDGFPNFYGWECYCGPKGLFIDSDGSVYYCQTKRNTGNPIFNVNTDDFTNYLTILDDPITCDEKGFCHEVVIPRRNNG